MQTALLPLTTPSLSLYKPRTSLSSIANSSLSFPSSSFPSCTPLVVSSFSSSKPIFSTPLHPSNRFHTKTTAVITSTAVDSSDNLNFLRESGVNSSDNLNFLRESVGNLTKVSMNIAKHLLSKPEFNERNAVISPLSLQTVLSMLALGSEGPTQHQLLSFLQSKSIDHLKLLCSQLVSSVLSDAAPAGGPNLSFANAVWVEKTLSLYPSFKEIVANMATIASLDFINKPDEAAEEVNLWAEKETKGLISDILQPGSIGSLTRLILTNALYFKGVWDQQFDALETKEYDFHLRNGHSVNVPFMTSKREQFISVFDGFKVLRLPYKQGKDKRQFSMYFFLPDAKDGLLPLIEKVTSENEFLEHKLPYNKVEVGDFRIPSFKISFDLETSDALKELGVGLPFSEGLTNIVDSPLEVSKIIQKSVINVNEEGTEAAVVTAMGIIGCGWPTLTSIPIDFVADHPFLFFIREDLSGTILFVGQVHNPLDG